MKVSLKQIGSHWCPFLTVCRDGAMFGKLSGDAQFPHEASDPFLTTRNSFCMQFRMNSWTSVHTSIVLKSRLDLRRKGRIFPAVLTRFTVVPGVIPADGNLKHMTHHRHWIVSTMLSNELILHSWLREKMLMAFFKMSRSCWVRSHSRLRR